MPFENRKADCISKGWNFEQLTHKTGQPCIIIDLTQIGKTCYFRPHLTHPSMVENILLFPKLRAKVSVLFSAKERVSGEVNCG